MEEKTSKREFQDTEWNGGGRLVGAPPHFIAHTTCHMWAQETPLGHSQLSGHGHQHRSLEYLWLVCSVWRLVSMVS